MNGTLEQDTVRDLLAQKQALLMELKHYENNSKYNEDISKYEQNLDINLDVIPANTRLQISITANDEKDKVVFEFIKYDFRARLILGFFAELRRDIHFDQQRHHHQSDYSFCRRYLQRRNSRGTSTSFEIKKRIIRTALSAKRFPSGYSH